MNNSRRRFLATGLKVLGVALPVAAALIGQPKVAEARGELQLRRRRRRRRN